MVVPCDAGLHWRRIRLYFQLFEHEFSTDEFRAALALQSEGATWLLGEPDSDCHSHVRLSSIKAPEIQPSGSGGRNEVLPSYFEVLVDTYRTSLREHGGMVDAISHTDFYHALAKGVIGEKVLHPTATVDLYYRSEDAKWRIALLANQPKFGEFGTDLGQVSLAGLTLRFTESKVALFDAQLDVSPTGHEYRCRVFFGWHADLSLIEHLYSRLIDQAESFAALFINTKVDHGRRSLEQPG